MRLTFFTTLFFLATEVAAQTPVQITAPLPSGYSQTAPGLIAYISSIYPFMIFLTAITAVGALVWGGILYITSGSLPENLSRAKSWMWSAILGLLIALGSYLILNTINPDILNLRISPF